ncbi:hypothetical protein [Microbacterium maritypicum]|uniref:HK97 gp10 family phage protein n=1 Tax=Microbacterium maritypicum MF109 TaxID=1333857 RepID=T5KJL0_MICMQ|nr:hypothetical protein [Microbacterium liquefaciens]EQM78210.1 hypothetical protein L687_16925 [Microbacterium maritypicum MF109]
MASAQAGSGFHKGGTVLIEGVNEVLKKLRDANASLNQMSDLMHSLGTTVVAAANPPRDSGEVAGTLRAGRGKTKAVVRAGYARRGAYAGVVHYGDPHRGHRADPFLTDALKRSQSQVITKLTDGIDDILRSNNLN